MSQPAEQCDVAVVGAGPAGATMALLLVQAGWSVTLLERARFPRDKLCGEFISAEGVAALAEMGLGQWLLRTCPKIDRVQVSARRGALWRERLPQPALGCSRAALDHQLLQHCRVAGVDVREGVRVTAVDDFDLSQPTVAAPASARAAVKLDSGTQLECRLVVFACGRQSALLRDSVERRFDANVDNGGMVGLKVHARATERHSAVELHAFDGGYIGLAPVEGERVNLCALLKSETLRRVGKDPQRLGDEVMADNRMLATRLEQLQPDWSQALAVANLRFGPVPVSGRWCLGDSVGAIAPLCGDGISMAVRTSQVAAPLVDRYLHGALSVAQALDSYRRQWQREFGLRIRLGNQLQSLLMNEVAGALSLRSLQYLPLLGRWVITQTRG